MKIDWKAVIVVVLATVVGGFLLTYIGYQVAPEEFCGDGVCQLNESCSSCEFDCGACPEPEAEVVIEVEVPELEPVVPPQPEVIEVAKEWDDTEYEHDFRSEDYRVVCKPNCRIAEPGVERTFRDVGTTYKFLKELTQSDIHPDLLPFEYHVSSDSTCNFERKGGFDQIAYASGFTDAGGTYRGLVCYDQDQYNINPAVLTHEITHLFQFRKFPSGGANEQLVTEGFADIVGSLSLLNNQVGSFCWDGNDIDGKFSSFPAGVGYPQGRQLFFELCDEYSFDVDDIPELFDKLEQDRPANTYGFILVINNIVGEDTTQTFVNNGIVF